MTLVQKMRNKLPLLEGILIHFGNARYFGKVLITYLVVISTVLLLTLPIYLQSYQILEQNVKDDSLKKIQQGLSILEQQTLAANELCYYLAAESSFTQLYKVEGYPAKEDYVAMINLQKNLTKLTNFYALNKEIYLMFPNNNIIISPNWIFDYQERGMSEIKRFGMDHEELRKILFSRTYFGEFLPAVTVTGYEQEKYSALLYVQSGSAVSAGKVRNIILIAYNTNQLISLLGLQDLQKSANVRLLYKDTLLYETQAVLSDKSQLTRIFCPATDNLGISVSVDISKYYFEEQLAGIRHMLFYFFGIALGVAIMFSGIFAYFQFRPLRKLLSVANSVSESPKVYQNTYHYVEQVLLSIRQNNLDMRKENNQLYLEIQDRLWNKLLLTGLNQQEKQFFMKSFPEFPKEFRLVTFKCYLNQNDDWDTTLQQKLNFCKDMVFDWVSASGDCYVIITYKEEDGQIQHFAEKLEATLLQIQQQYSCVIRAGISSVESNIEAIPLAYKETYNAIKYLECEFVITLPEKAESKSPFVINFEEYRRLTETLLSADIKKAHHTIYSQWYAVIQQSPALNVTDHLFYIHVGILYNVAMTVGYTGELPTYDNEKSILELVFQLADAAEKLCEFIKENRDNSSKQLAHEITTYINKNYTNPNFYMADLVDIFSLSDRTISKIIQNQTGKKFSDYLESLKSAQAERLLNVSSLPISEVAEKCGFASRNTFYKAFKRIYGISPSIYRENIQKELLPNQSE